jgi:hypothetical protein
LFKRTNGQGDTTSSLAWLPASCPSSYSPPACLISWSSTHAAEVEAARTELHSGSEAEEGSVAWPDEADASSGSDEEGGCQAGADGTGSDGDEGADRERPDGGRPRLRQARIRFGAVPLQPTAPPAQQRTGVGRSGDGIRKQGTPPAQGAQPEATAAQETPAPQRPSSAVGRIRRVDIRSFFSPRQQQRQQETQHTE